MTNDPLDGDREEEPLPLLDRAVLAFLCVVNGVLGFYMFGNLVCGLESPEVIPKGLGWAAIPFLYWSVLASLGFAFGYGIVRWIRFQRGPDTRWRNAQCPACGHSMPPKLARAICSECGGDLARPSLSPSPVPRLFVRFVVAVATGALASLLWLGIDIYRFRLDVALDPTMSAQRARAWPFSGAHLVYNSTSRDFSAHD